MTKAKSLSEAELRKKYALKEVSKFYRNIMRFLNKFNKDVSEAKEVFKGLSACEKDTVLRILNVEAKGDLEYQMACQEIFDEGRREVYATAYSMPVEMSRTQSGVVKAKGAHGDWRVSDTKKSRENANYGDWRVSDTKKSRKNANYGDWPVLDIKKFRKNANYGDWRVLGTKKSRKNENYGDWRVLGNAGLSNEKESEQNVASYLPTTYEEEKFFERLKERKELQAEARLILEMFHSRFLQQPIEHLRNPQMRGNLIREEEEQRLKQISQELKATAGPENKKRTPLSKIIRQLKSQDGK